MSEENPKGTCTLKAPDQRPQRWYAPIDGSGTFMCDCISLNCEGSPPKLTNASPRSMFCCVKGGVGLAIELPSKVREMSSFKANPMPVPSSCASPAGFQKVAVQSSATPTKAPPIESAFTPTPGA